ncbi:hypothetical protein VTJ83DRAFT_3533 [Remersonia thermophila]|uniref:Uncharacterized protein n=1 Tax=Remersonia thermophila TaxID=72144 RepID=A0ABR4DEC2_9PEZI
MERVGFASSIRLFPLALVTTSYNSPIVLSCVNRGIQPANQPTRQTINLERLTLAWTDGILFPHIPRHHPEARRKYRGRLADSHRPCSRFCLRLLEEASGDRGCGDDGNTLQPGPGLGHPGQADRRTNSPRMGWNSTKTQRNR